VKYDCSDLICPSFHREQEQEGFSIPAQLKVLRKIKSLPDLQEALDLIVERAKTNKRSALEDDFRTFLLWGPVPTRTDPSGLLV
jgi:hypothetical protein